MTRKSEDKFDFDELISDLEKAAKVFHEAEVKKGVAALEAAGHKTATVQDAVKAVAIQDAAKAAAFIDAVAALATHDAAKAVAVQDAVKAVAVQDAAKAAVGMLREASAAKFSRADIERSIEIIRLAASIRKP